MKYVFWGVFAVGFMLCTSFGIGPVLARANGDWLSPYMLVGIALGVVLLALAVAFAIGYRPSLLPSDTAMVIALAIAISAKVGVAGIQTALAR